MNWGAADQFNPTGLLNPLDLEDPTRFGDRVANEMLRHLGHHGLAALLRVVNASWLRGEVPRAWRVAEIIPVFKGKDKNPNDAKSYRPVSLTSCAAKLVKHMVRARLQYVVERWGLGLLCALGQVWLVMIRHRRSRRCSTSSPRMLRSFLTLRQWKWPSRR